LQRACPALSLASQQATLNHLCDLLFIRARRTDCGWAEARVRPWHRFPLPMAQQPPHPHLQAIGYTWKVACSGASSPSLEFVLLTVLVGADAGVRIAAIATVSFPWHLSSIRIDHCGAWLDILICVSYSPWEGLWREPTRLSID